LYSVYLAASSKFEWYFRVRYYIDYTQKCQPVISMNEIFLLYNKRCCEMRGSGSIVDSPNRAKIHGGNHGAINASFFT
jgi:hypothetical protein